MVKNGWVGGGGGGGGPLFRAPLPYVSSLVYFLNCWPFVRVLIPLPLAEDDGSRAANSNINEKNVCPAAVRKGYGGSGFSVPHLVPPRFSFHFPRYFLTTK